MVQMLYNHAKQHGSNDARILLTVNGCDNESDDDGLIHRLHRYYEILGFDKSTWTDVPGHMSRYEHDNMTPYILHKQVSVTHSIFNDIYSR